MDSETLDKLVEFVDNKERVWHPKFKIKHVSDLEKRRGVAFFPVALELGVELSKLPDNVSEDKQILVILKTSKALLGNIGDTIRFLYDGLRDESGEVVYKGVVIDYDDFYNGIDRNNILRAMMCAVFGIITFFPRVDNTGGDGRPFAKEAGHIAGEMCTNSQD